MNHKDTATFLDKEAHKLLNSYHVFPIHRLKVMS